MGDLAFDAGPDLAVGGLPFGGGLEPLARCRTTSRRWMLIVRPDGEAVQRARSGHDAQAEPNAALASPSEPGQRIAATCPAGHVTVWAARSTTKSSKRRSWLLIADALVELLGAGSTVRQRCVATSTGWEAEACRFA
jgi:hypothetical protein